MVLDGGLGCWLTEGLSLYHLAQGFAVIGGFLKPNWLGRGYLATLEWMVVCAYVVMIKQFDILVMLYLSLITILFYSQQY